MEKDIDHVRLVKRAQLGDKECLERLARLAEESLRSDVLRMTLEPHLTDDIVQETILKMLKVLGELKEADRFWPWLYKTALNKVRLHHRSRKCGSTVSLEAMADLSDQKASQEAMSNLVAEELRQIVFKAMWQLKPRHRVVLTLRCYKEMDYPAIAQTMQCSEFAARKLFLRAKRALKRQLARHGFGKGSLLMALVLFGKMTASSKAAAAKVSVTAATTKVGVSAALVEMVSSKTAVLSLATAGVLGIGAFVASPGADKMRALSSTEAPGSLHTAGWVSHPSTVSEEYWYYFPQGKDAAVMMRVMTSDIEGKNHFCQWAQDMEANYYLDRRRNSLFMTNYRQWNRDLSVWRLPTDSVALTDFLSQIEGSKVQMQSISKSESGLVVVVRPAANGTSSWTTHHYRMLEEDYSVYSWPTDVRAVDNRDAMHKRGWAYFKIEGRIGRERVSGAGRLPFVYAAAAKYSHWLRLKVGNRLALVDNGRMAVVYDDRERVTASYAGGSFFKGLSRPWMGLHTIDTVRRDAAEQQISFETKFDSSAGIAEVALSCDQGKLVYAIDMERDVVDKIVIASTSGIDGELRFEYLQGVHEVSSEFVRPRVRRHGPARDSQGILWLTEVATKLAEKDK
jgi:RNA polymerase sigma-70 factor (ECF subfamily)